MSYFLIAIWILMALYIGWIGIDLAKDGGPFKLNKMMCQIIAFAIFWPVALPLWLIVNYIRDYWI